MRELIYYPTFEVKDREWLKFALLYLKKLNPIIPESGDLYLSDEYKMIINETDLIQRHRPSQDEGRRASLDAIDQMERILRYPETFIEIFSDKNFLKKWRDPKEQKFRLFSEKYAQCWEDFCLANRIGKGLGYGFMVSRDVANIYMTILAQCIADSYGISPITDDRFLDRFSFFLKKASPNSKNTVEAAQGIINLKLPGNLRDISFEEVIKHRNKQDFKQHQKAFHNELENYLKKIEDADKDKSFEESLGNIWSDFSDEVLKIGSGTITFSLGVWLLLQSGDTSMLQAWKELAGGSVMIIGSIISVRNTWKNTRTPRMARRYLADLQDLALVTG